MNYTGEIEVKESLVGNLNMLKLINGYSAYELALKCGYKGTLEEWLESLKVKGDPGTMELFGELDAKGERIMNVADPEEDGDAVNRRFFENAVNDWMSENELPDVLKEMKEGKVLPIENGGTGGNTAEEALKKLGAMPAKATSLGNSGKDVDKITDPGFYYGISNYVENAPFSYFFLEVGEASFVGGTIFYYQKAINLETGVMAFRRRKSAPVGFAGVEWEYENPPMFWHSQLLSPIVYKTTERFNGKPVYTAMIHIDSFEDGKTVDLSGNEPGETEAYKSGIFGQVLRYQGYLYGDSHECTKTLPYIQPSTEDVAYSWLTFKNDADKSGFKIKMQMHGYNAPFDANGKLTCNKGYVQIWFVKP